MVAAFGTWGGWAALTAIGTVGAVVVAIGLQGWLSWSQRRRRPSLTLAFDSHMKVDETNPPSGARLPFLRLAVSNAKGKEAAADVEVLVVNVQEISVGPVGGGGRYVWLANPALSWTHHTQVVGGNLLPSTRMSIPSGATRYLDVGCWLPPIPLKLTLSVFPIPGSKRHELVAGTWRLELDVTLQNGDVTRWYAQVGFAEKVVAGLAQPVDVTGTVTPAGDR